MRYRRRRKGGAWLPVNPTYIGEIPAGKTYFEDSTATPDGLNIETGEGAYSAIPLTLDDTQNYDNQPDASMRDFVEGQEYILNRVVGKVWCGLANQANGQPALVRALATAAVCVLPAEPNTNSPSIAGIDWNPVLAANAQEPWLWRRQWVLSPPAQTVLQEAIFPSTSAGYTGMNEGGHIDTKGVKRRITREHRLFMIFGLDYLATVSGQEAVGGQFIYGFDVRLNGGMRRARNRSSF